MTDKIQFIGLVVRYDNGQTLAFDLDGEDVKLKFEMSMEGPRVDVTEFGRDDLVRMPPPERVDVSVGGRRRPNASKLLVTRLIKDGEVPFPAFESAP
jgi:hypothetical protein